MPSAGICSESALIPVPIYLKSEVIAFKPVDDISPNKIPESFNIMSNVFEAHPYSWIYFISFILVTSVVLLNMVIGIIVDVMSRDARENLFDNIDANDHVVTKENEGL